MEVGQKGPWIKNFSSAYKMNMTKAVQKASYWIQKQDRESFFPGQGDSNRSQRGKAVSTGIC